MTDPYAEFGGSVASPIQSDPYAAFGGSIASPGSPVDGRAALNAALAKLRPNAKPVAPSSNNTFLNYAADATSGVLDPAIGAQKALARNASGAASLINKIPVVGESLAPKQGVEAMDKYLANTNAAQTAGGVVENLAELALPVEKVATALPSAARAGEAFQDVMKVAKDIPVDASAAADRAMEIKKLADSGASMPKVVKNFLKRISDADQGPLTYEEARNFYSNASGRLSQAELFKLTPRMRYELAQFTQHLDSSIADAADTVGQLDKYRSAMSEYHNAMKVKTAIQSGGALLGKAGAAATIGAGGAAGAKIMYDLLKTR